MKNTGLRTVVYKVSDIDKAKKWYAEVFKVQPYFDQPFYVGFSIGGFELGLQPDDVGKGESVVAYWAVDNVQAEYKRMIELGASGFEGPQDVGEGIVVAAVKDPWGNPVGIIFNPHFKQ